MVAGEAAVKHPSPKLNKNTGEGVPVRYRCDRQLTWGRLLQVRSGKVWASDPPSELWPWNEQERSGHPAGPGPWDMWHHDGQAAVFWVHPWDVAERQRAFGEGYSRDLARAGMYGWRVGEECERAAMLLGLMSEDMYAEQNAAAVSAAAVFVGPAGAATGLSGAQPDRWARWFSAPLPAITAFRREVRAGAAWSAALAAFLRAAGGATVRDSSGAPVDVSRILHNAAALEQWAAQLLARDPEAWGEHEHSMTGQLMRWGVSEWVLPVPASARVGRLHPVYLFARRFCGLSDVAALGLASRTPSRAAASAALVGRPVAASRLPSQSSRVPKPTVAAARRPRATAAPRRAAEAGSPVVAVGAGAAVGALAGPALLGTGLGVSAAGGALAGYLLAGGASAATLGAPDTPPHEGDYWISTDDARDYARWLAGKVEALHTEAAAWMYDWSTLERANEWFRATDWQDWRSKWRAYHADLEDSWASRVGAWRDIKAWHGEYRAKRDHAAALGLPLSSASAAPLPDEVTDQLHRGAGEWWAEVTGGVARAGLGVLLLGAGVLALVWASQDV